MPELAEVAAMLTGATGAAFAFVRWLVIVIREEAKSSRATHEKVSSDHLHLISTQLNHTNASKLADREAFSDATSAFREATAVFSHISRSQGEEFARVPRKEAKHG